MENFRKLGLTEPILKVLREERFEKPTEIQEKTIPLVLDGKDIIAGSATGSGKTLAFAAGIVQNLKKGNGIQALILTPTRELAEQVAKAIRKFAKNNPLHIAMIYGGVGIGPQVDELRRSDVVVGTPGRVLDHIGRGTVDFSRVKIMILDEADRMLDMGFIEDVENIIKECPRERQTLLFSATISTEISRLSHKYMHDAVQVSAKSYVDPSKLKQVYYDVADGLKFSLLVHFLKKDHSGLIMVFCGTRRNTDFVAKNLKAHGITTLAIHGGFTQAKRSATMKDFHSQNFDVLVCTDVAARGLDIKGVSHVYNYDIPKDTKEYVHRIGRTARAGKEGKVINILASRDYDNFSSVQRDHSIKITKEHTPKIERVAIKRMEPDREGFGRRRFGSRGGSGGRRFGGGASGGRRSSSSSGGRGRGSSSSGSSSGGRGYSGGSSSGGGASAGKSRRERRGSR